MKVSIVPLDEQSSGAAASIASADLVGVKQPPQGRTMLIFVYAGTTVATTPPTISGAIIDSDGATRVGLVDYVGQFKWWLYIAHASGTHSAITATWAAPTPDVECFISVMYLQGGNGWQLGLNVNKSTYDVGNAADLRVVDALSVYSTGTFDAADNVELAIVTCLSTTFVAPGGSWSTARTAGAMRPGTPVGFLWIGYKRELELDFFEEGIHWTGNKYFSCLLMEIGDTTPNVAGYGSPDSGRAIGRAIGSVVSPVSGTVYAVRGIVETGNTDPIRYEITSQAPPVVTTVEAAPDVFATIFEDFETHVASGTAGSESVDATSMRVYGNMVAATADAAEAGVSFRLVRDPDALTWLVVTETPSPVVLLAGNAQTTTIEEGLDLIEAALIAEGVT